MLLLSCRRDDDWLQEQRHSVRASVTPHAFPPCSGWCLRKDGGRRSGWSGYPERRGRGTVENTAKKGRHLVRLELKHVQRHRVAVGWLCRGCQRHEEWESRGDGPCWQLASSSLTGACQLHVCQLGRLAVLQLTLATKLSMMDDRPHIFLFTLNGVLL